MRKPRWASRKLLALLVPFFVALCAVYLLTQRQKGDPLPRETQPVKRAGLATQGAVPIYTDWPFDAREARRRQRETARTLGVPVEKEVSLEPGLAMRFALIPAGDFKMGSDDVRTKEDQRPVHEVRITEPFYMSVTEVTIAHYRAFLANSGDESGVNWDREECPLAKGRHGYSPSGNEFGRNKLQPMVSVSWKGARSFCRMLTGETGREARLPTEAQWEYACRAGSETAYHFGRDENQFAKYGWYDGNAKDEGEEYAHVMGRKKPNAWGLYDMHGNVWEWCRDCYEKDYYEISPTENPGDQTVSYGCCGEAHGILARRAVARPTAAKAIRGTHTSTSVSAWCYCVRGLDMHTHGAL